MDLDKLNRWSILFANLGVLIGIFFLAFELRQNNDLMAADARFNQYTAMTNSMLAIVENSDISAIFAKTITGEELLPEESIALTVFQRQGLYSRAWIFNELSEDEIPIAQWRRGFQDPSLREVWEREKSDFDLEFVQFIERNILND